MSTDTPTKGASNHEVTVVDTPPEALLLTREALLQRRQVISDLLAQIMQEDVHFGIVPGTQKYSLYKAGAELICSTFRLAPRYAIEKEKLDGGHLTYQIQTTLYHVGTAAMWGEGVGSCSTLESKYRYVRGAENKDIANTYNTVLKMAKKRSLVDAILTATAASDMFFRPDDEEDDESVSAPLATRVITQQQIGTLLSACSAFGVSEERLKAYLAQTYQIASRKEIPVDTFGEILSWVKQQGAK